MIKFFGRIRKDLLAESKFTKYLLYAVGEILLVVIGILIALSINDWNDRRRNAESELLYYQRILEDFELDKKLIEELLEKDNKRIEISKAILLDLDAGTKDKKYLLNQFLLANRFDVFVPRNVTFKDLVSSGNLRLLNDISIKNSLIQYYSELDNKQAQIENNRDEIVRSIFALLNTSIEFGGIQEFDYVNQLLDQKIIETLPNVDWTKQKDSEYYKNFQMSVLFNIAMAEREKQLLSAINNLMEQVDNLLKEKCKYKK